MKKGNPSGGRKKTLKNLIGEDPELLERGLDLIEAELEIGHTMIDLLCSDPACRPVLVYLLKGVAEEREAPLRVLDGDSSFRSHVPVLRKLFSGAEINWELPPRAVVVNTEFSRQTMERFESISALEIDLLEFRSIKVRGEQRWASVPVSGDALKESLMPAQPVPETLEDPFARNLWHSVYDRILKLDPRLEILADKYHREISSQGYDLVTMESGGQSFRVVVPAPGVTTTVDRQPSVVMVEDEEKADQAVDLVIRRFLAIRAQEDENTCASQEETIEVSTDEDLPLEEFEPAVHTSILTDEEISAFLDHEEMEREGE